jgi:hypothetical protein
MPPMMPQPQGNPMSNPQLFAQMLQQQGYAPQANLQSGPPPGAPPQGMPPGGMQPQAGQPPQQRPMMPGPAQGPQGVPPQGASGQGGAPQIPPQLQQMLMQHMMQQQAQQRGQRPQGQPGQNKFTPQELAGLGRMGDTTVAHLTPGEVEVPPQVQTPKVLAAIDHAFKNKGVDPQKFVAGSPQSSVNPKTGMPEYNFWSSFLPMAMSVGGGLIGGPLGAAAGDSLGGIMTGNSLMGSLEGGALSGLGDWGGGQLSNAITGNAPDIMGANGLGSSGVAPTSDLPAGVGTGGIDATSINAGTGVPNSAPIPGGAGASGASGASGAAAPQSQSMLSSLFNNPASAITSLGQGNMPQNTNSGNLIGAGAGAGLGSLLANNSTSATSSQMPSYMSQPYLNANQLPSWQQQVGTGNYKGVTPQFNGYNPATNYPAAYNFYPQQPTANVPTPTTV